MTHNTRRRTRAIALAIGLCTASMAFAADPVTDAMQAAYGPYRMALYKTNGNSQADAQQSLMQAREAWDKLGNQFAAKPAAPYDRDPAFAASVAEVAKVYDQALKEVGANQLSAAHGTLEHAREVMAHMRQRNHVVVFSDHMNAYHSQMEHVLINGAQTLAQPKGMLDMTARVGALSYLADRLTAEASADLKNNPEFAALLKAVTQSVAQLQAALLNQDLTAVKEGMGKLKGPYSKLFAKFG